MKIKRSGDVNRVKAVVVAGLLATSTTVTTVGLVEGYKNYKQEQKMQEALRIKERKIQEMIETKQKQEKHKEVLKLRGKALEEKIAEEKRRIAKEKRERVIQEMRDKTGLPVVDFQEKEITITFYGDTYEQNGGYPNITCTGETLTEGMVASNVYPLGTKIMWEGQVRTVADRGGSHFDSPNRLDVFLPRHKGESDSDYIKRIYQNGKRTIKATILELE